MSVDWDVDAYKTEFETDEHWELKKRFMLAHKDKFPEDELVCLAQVFTNIEFMGCRYPDETMKRVAILARGVVEDFREKKKNCLKRTFVAASDAASAKFKGLIASQAEKPTLDPDEREMKLKKIEEIKAEKLKKIEEMKAEKLKKIEEMKAEKLKKIEELKAEKLRRKLLRKEQKERKRKYKQMKLNELNALKKAKLLNEKRIQLESKSLSRSKSILDSFVVLYFDKKENPLSILMKSAAANNCEMSWGVADSGVGDNKITKLFFNKELIAEAEDENIKKSRRKTAKAALEVLKENCYGVKLNKEYRAVGVSNSDFGASENGSPSVLGDNNVGAKLMLLMGWKGGGLGRKEQGIKEPITPNMVATREGLGSTVGLSVSSKPETDLKAFKKRAENFIRNWLFSDSTDDLVFSPEFTTEERRELHLIAHALCLKSKSRGKKNNRRLVISRKQHPLQIVQDLIKAGGCTKKFQLVYPAKLLPQTPGQRRNQ